MNCIELFTEHDIARLYDWITELGELFIRLENHNSGAAGRDYLVHNLDELRDLISRQSFGDIEIHIFRAIIFPIRGNDYSVLLQSAIQKIPEGQYYQIVALPPHTRECKYLELYECESLADGKGHDELRKDIANLEPGRNIAIGVHPFDPSYEEFEQVYGGAVEKLSLEVHIDIHKNLNWYDNFSNKPAMYQDVIRRWFVPDKSD